MNAPDETPGGLSGVGWSALLVAAGRAVETHRPDGLVDDPWAEIFVERAGLIPAMATRPEQRWPDPTREGDARTAVDEFWTLMETLQGVRSRFIDQALLEATGAGASQVVLLAAGLDARALRLDWPAATTIYEVDQPQVLAFKDRVLRDEGARPRTARRVVPVDLRGDWSDALRRAGLDPTRPTAWLAEGLLPFLPAAAETALLHAVGTHTGPGSTFAVDDFAEVVAQMRLDPAVARFGRPYGIDMGALPDPVLDRPRPGDQLVEQGWAVEQITGAVSLASTYGRSMPTTSSGLNLDSRLLIARR